MMKILWQKLRNRPIHTYMCMECSERIAERTMERHASGNFRLYRDKSRRRLVKYK